MQSSWQELTKKLIVAVLDNSRYGVLSHKTQNALYDSLSVFCRVVTHFVKPLVDVEAEKLWLETDCWLKICLTVLLLQFLDNLEIFEFLL